MTFKITVRGTPTPTTIADYHCPIHGRFEMTVERTPEGDAPDEVRCQSPIVPPFPVADRDSNQDLVFVQCVEVATWCISAPLARVNKVEAVKGKWQKPERKTWTDTRNLGEGQALYDWKEDRAKVWEEKRKQDVVNFAREHNERVIGGD